MDEIKALFSAIADSLLEYRKKEDESKYGPVVTREEEFNSILEAEEFETYFISRLPAGKYATIKEIDGIRTLLIDTEEVPKKVLMQHRDKFQEAYKQAGGIALGDRSGIASAMDTVDDVYELNQGRLPSRLLPVFEEALVLRSVERRKYLSRGTVYDWRGEIASNYSESGYDPEVAQYLISLCSTGYFDEGDLFDEMFSKLVEDDSRTIGEFKSIISRYIKNNPFAVFVRADGMSSKEASTLAKAKLNELDETDQYTYPPDFVDVCGKGKEAHAIIDSVRDRLSDDGGFEMSVRRNRSIDQKVLRVRFESD